MSGLSRSLLIPVCLRFALISILLPSLAHPDAADRMLELRQAFVRNHLDEVIEIGRSMLESGETGPLVVDLMLDATWKRGAAAGAKPTRGTLSPEWLPPPGSTGEAYLLEGWRLMADDPDSAATVLTKAIDAFSAGGEGEGAMVARARFIHALPTAGRCAEIEPHAWIMIEAVSETRDAAHLDRSVSIALDCLIDLQEPSLLDSLATAAIGASRRIGDAYSEPGFLHYGASAAKMRGVISDN